MRWLQEFDPIGELLRSAGLGDQLEFVNAFADPKLALVQINDAHERLAAYLPSYGLSDQVFVLSEEQPAKGRGTIQQRRIQQARRSVFLCGENVYAA
jgi:hypothetical protein